MGHDQKREAHVIGRGGTLRGVALQVYATRRHALVSLPYVLPFPHSVISSRIARPMGIAPCHLSRTCWIFLAPPAVGIDRTMRSVVDNFFFGSYRAIIYGVLHISASANVFARVVFSSFIFFTYIYILLSVRLMA